MHPFPLIAILSAFAITGTVLHRRVPGTLRASERLTVTAVAVYLQFQISLAIPGLLGVLNPVWTAFTALFLTAIVLIVVARFSPEPLLKLPGGDHPDSDGLRWSAFLLLGFVALSALYALVLIFYHPVGYDDCTIYLTRVAQWLQDSKITVMPSDDPRAIATPIPAAFPALFHVMYLRTAFAIGIWNWFGWLMCGLAVYVASQRWLESRYAGIVSAGITLLAPSMLLQTQGLAPTGWEIAFAVVGFHFLAHGRQRPQHARFAHMVATVALACSASLQNDLPLSLLIFAVLLLVYRPPIQRRIILRNLVFFLVIAGWSHVYNWFRFGYPTAPLLADVFGTATGAANPMFHSLVSSTDSFVSLVRIAARISSAILPIPIGVNDAVLNIGAFALLAGLSGLLMAFYRQEESFIADPVFVGLFVVSLVSFVVAPSLLWRETPILAPVVLCGLGAGYLFKLLAQRKIVSILVTVIPTLIMLCCTVLASPTLQPVSPNTAQFSNAPYFLKSFSLPDRVAIYRTDWTDIWTLRQPLSQPRTIVGINPQLEPDWAFFKAGRAGCDWLIMTDSPLHRYRMPENIPVPKEWEIIFDETRMLYDSPGWIRVVVFCHTSRSVALR